VKVCVLTCIGIQVLKQKFGLAQSSLTNLQKLLEATQIAIVDTKNQLAMVQDHIGI
jgi:hypothetical protein